MSRFKHQIHEVVIPYGNDKAQSHIRFEGDYKTFCGKTCDNWTVSDSPVWSVVESVYCCKRCRTAYYS